MRLAATLAFATLAVGCGTSSPVRPDGGDGQAAAAAEAVDTEVPEAAGRDYAAALAAMRSGDFADAESRLERLMADYPTLAGPYVNAAIVYRRDGRRDEALAALQQALAVAPGHAAANNELGILLRERGDFAGAEQAYRRALETAPDYPLALYNLGVLLDVYLRRQEEALAYYERYQQALPEPDETVARWIIDLKRRVGAAAEPRVAQEEAP